MLSNSCGKRHLIILPPAPKNRFFLGGELFLKNLMNF
jgi:hypothetical protein